MIDTISNNVVENLRIENRDSPINGAIARELSGQRTERHATPLTLMRLDYYLLPLPIYPDPSLPYTISYSTYIYQRRNGKGRYDENGGAYAALTSIANTAICWSSSSYIPLHYVSKWWCCIDFL